MGLTFVRSIWNKLFKKSRKPAKKIRVVEIGATHIRKADVTGPMIKNIEIHRTQEVLSGDIITQLQTFADKNWMDDIEKLVILVAGPVDNNIVKLMPNFPEFGQNIDLTKELKFDVPILVFNDMTAAVTGMAAMSKKQNIAQAFWGLTWSTGLGGKFWDGEKISIDKEIGHEIKINNTEAETLLGGRHMTEETGRTVEEITDPEFLLKKARLMGEFLLELDKIKPSSLFVFKGAISKNWLTKRELVDQIKSVFNKEVILMLSPNPDNDSFIGARILAQKDG